MKKRLLSMLMAVLMIASLVPATALAAGTDVNAHYGHDVQTFNIKADAATKQPGIKLTYCNTCAMDDKSTTNPIVSALVVTPFMTGTGVCQKDTHDTKGTYVLQKATCDQPGLKVTYCTKCGTAVNVSPATSALIVDFMKSGHTYSQFTVSQAPTCTSVGWGYTVCDKCGEAAFVYGVGTAEDAKTANSVSAMHYLYLNKKAADVKTSDAEAVAALFKATNPKHATNDSLVTPTENVYDTHWVVPTGSEVGHVEKYVKYNAAVEPTHAAFVSGVFDVNGTKGVQSTTRQYALKDENGQWISGLGYSGDTYCKDCGIVTEKNKALNSLDYDLTGVHFNMGRQTIVPAELGYLPYMTLEGVKVDGKADVYNCPECGAVGGQTIPYETLFAKSFDDLEAFQENLRKINGLYKVESGNDVMSFTYGYTTADEVVIGAYAASCTTKGYTGDTYKLIGNDVDGYKWTKTASGTYTDALGHQLEAVESKAATCQSEGWTVSDYYVCSRNNYKDNYYQGTCTYDAKKASHDWAAKTLVANICLDKGLTVVVCNDCGALAQKVENKYSVAKNIKTTKDVYITEAAAAPHKAGELVNVKEATCTEKGYTGDAFCVWCNTQLVKGSETALKEHTPVDVKEVPATCTENGTEAGTKCSVCETVLSGCEVITAEGHKYVKQDDAVAATCTENGKEASEKCSVCDDVIEGKVIDALGHKYENGVCTACGAKDPEYVAPEFKDAASIAEYAKEAVTWAANAQVVKGDDMGNFNPTANITRQDFVTMLWRLKGEAASNQALTFTDKADIAEYAATAVAWAVENGYIKGYEDGSFAPTANITRAEIVTILDRIAGNAKAEKEATFTDVVGHWAAAEIAWAAEKGVVNGVGDNKFAPDDNATRQDTVVMLYRFANLK